MDPLMDVIKNSEEPEWLEKPVVGELRVWQLVFLSLCGMTTLVVMVCCCFRFRIPRTKQQIEADYQRRKITTKFRQELETIQDNKIDSMSLDDALELLHEKKNPAMSSHAASPDNSTSPQQGNSVVIQSKPTHNRRAKGSMDTSYQVEGQKPEPQVSGSNFVKFATKVAHLSKLGQPKSPTSPTPSATNEKINF